MFIKNFSRIVALLTLILRTTANNDLGAQASRHKEDQNVTAGGGGAGSGTSGGRSIKNLSNAVKSAKSKKPNFAKTNSGTNFLTPRAKEAFIHL